MLKKISVPQLIGIVSGAVALVLLIGGLLIFFFAKPSNTIQPTSTADSAPSTADEAKSAQPLATADAKDANGKALTNDIDATLPGSASAADGTAATGAGSQSAAQAPLPAALTALLSEGGYSAGDLQAYGVNQLVTVRSAGATAEVSFFENTGSGWQQNDALTCHGYIGENGTTPNMSEGAAATPQGLFSIGSAFYQGEAPATGLDSFHITSDTYWIDDPDSERYNQRVVGEDEPGGAHAEYMSENIYYCYGFVINYNIPPTGYARGSAIFFHVSHDSPTLGCVTVSEEMVLAYLAQLDASRNPYILII